MAYTISAYLRGKLLQPSNVDWTLFRGVEVTRTHTQVRGRAHHATRETKRVVREDKLTSSIVVLRDGAEEGRKEEGRRN